MKTSGRRPLTQTSKASITKEGRGDHPPAAVDEGKVALPQLFFLKIHDPSLIMKKYQTNSNGRAFYKTLTLVHNLDITENKVRVRNCPDRDIN